MVGTCGFCGRRRMCRRCGALGGWWYGLPNEACERCDWPEARARVAGEVPMIATLAEVVLSYLDWVVAVPRSSSPRSGTRCFAVWVGTACAIGWRPPSM